MIASLRPSPSAAELRPKVPAEGDIVALSPKHLRDKSASPWLRFVHGQLHSIEHVHCMAYGYVTWDHPGIAD